MWARKLEIPQPYSGSRWSLEKEQEVQDNKQNRDGMGWHIGISSTFLTPKLSAPSVIPHLNCNP
ncbi:hypothetical protein BVRB_1g014650 [Beta vulgaris subsp. vulgaris]|nr:hypothetical protein BVRB_1g014650 [Beta vulgaris subsp. vulgaris]